MNRIDTVFQKLRQEGRTALMPFITAGDPNLDITIEIIKQLEQSGADLIELGVPYSDPLADGPVIQRASSRALTNRISILDCIHTAKKAIDAGVQIPIILFTYYNPALQLGLDRFFALLAEHEISGAIIPDLPHEEDEEARLLAAKHGIHLIPLVAPTSNARIQKIVSRATGFIYCVSSLGVTGERTSFYAGVNAFLDAVKSATNLPIAIGFGISNNKQFREFAAKCDGVIVGSAIVRKIEEMLPLLSNEARRAEGLATIGQFVAELKQ